MQPILHEPASGFSLISGVPPVHTADHMPHSHVQTVEHVLKFGSCIYEGSPTKTGTRPNRDGCSSGQRARMPAVAETIDKKPFRVTRIRVGRSRHDRERVRAQQRIASGAVDARSKADKIEWRSNPSSVGVHSSYV
jgi:hypothetical protein